MQNEMIRVDSALLGKVFGAATVRCRKAKGMKQEELAQAAGLSRPRLSQIEGGHLPRFENGVWIANVLGVSIDAMLAPLLLSKALLAPGDAFQELAAMPPEIQYAIRRFVQRLFDDVALLVPDEPERPSS